MEVKTLDMTELLYICIPIITVVVCSIVFFLGEIFQIWWSSRQEIDVTIRLFKLDFRYEYNINTWHSVTVTPVIEEKEDSETWTISKPFIVYKSVMEMLAFIFHLCCLAILRFMPPILFSMRDHVSLQVSYRWVWAIAIVLIVLIIVSVPTVAKIMKWLEDLEIQYKGRVIIIFDIRQYIRYTLKYFNKLGLTYEVCKIEQSMSAPIKHENPRTTTEEMKAEFYKQMLKKQWERLEKFYHVSKQYHKFIALANEDFNPKTEPLLMETINRLTEIGYEVLIRGKSFFLKFNGDEKLRNKFITNQWNAIMDRHFLKISRLLTIAEIQPLDDEHPLFQENITRFTENGFNISYEPSERDRDTASLKLHFCYRVAG